MRILVTGATGFVGAHVARVLVEQKQDVSALVRLDKRSRRLV